MQNLTFPSSWFSSGAAQTNKGKRELNQLHHHPAALRQQAQPAASLFGGGGYVTNPQYMWRSSAAGSQQPAPSAKRRSMDASKEVFGLDGGLPSQPVVLPLGGGGGPASAGGPAINNNINVNVNVNNTNNAGPGTGRRSSLPGVMPSSTGGMGAYPLPFSPLSAGGGAGGITATGAARKKSGISGKELQQTPEQREAGKGRWIVVLSRCLVLSFFTICLGLSMAEERFGVLSRLGCVFAPESNAASLRQMDKYILAVVVSFGMSFVIDFLGALYSVSREKRLLYTLSSSVHLLGGTTKVLLYLRALPVLVDFAGRPLYMVHYLQWSCTTPMLILLIGRLSLASRKKLLLVMVLDVLTMVTGFFSSFCFNFVFVLFWGTLSFVFFFMVLYGVHHFIQLAIAHYPSKERSFNGLFAVTATCWSVFPIIWLLGAFDLVNPDIELYAYLTIDVSVKVVFSVFLRQVTLSSIEHREVQEYEKFKEAKEQAESLAELHRQFLSNMSHEIRTPLNSVIGFSGLLMETNLDPIQRDYARSSLTSGEALLGIIDNILEFSKFESDKVKLEHEPFDLGAVVDELEDILTPLTHKKQTELIFDCGSEVPVFLRGDPFRLRQILINLVNNAIKFSNKGGEVIVAVRTSQYLAHASHHQEGPGWVELYFSVTDRGIGIEPEKVADLFKPFSQVQKGNARKFGGSGLGLAICRKLVEAMDGHIFVERTAPGLGTTIAFTVRMQLQAVHGEEGDMMTHRLVPQKAADLNSASDVAPAAPSSMVLEMSDRKLCLPHIDGTKLRVCILVRNDALGRWLKKTIKGWGAKCKRIKSAKVWQDSGDSSDDSDDSDSDDSTDEGSDYRRSKSRGRGGRHRSSKPRRNDWMDLVKKYHRGWNFDTILADYIVRKRDTGGRSNNELDDNDFELSDGASSGGSGGSARRQDAPGRNNRNSTRVLHAVYLINFEERIMIAKQGHHDEIEAASGSNPQLIEHFCPKPIKLRYLFQQLQTIASSVDRCGSSSMMQAYGAGGDHQNLDVPQPKVRRRRSGSKSDGGSLSPSPRESRKSGGPNEELRALVVEDNKINQKVIGAMLKRLKIDHDFAENGEEALNILGEGLHHYEIVFMDIQMPVMDGLTAAREIRRKEALGELTGLPRKIVGLTACAMKEDRDACLRAGMDYYLSKPVKLAGLMELVERVRGGL